LGRKFTKGAEKNFVGPGKSAAEFLADFPKKEQKIAIPHWCTFSTILHCKSLNNKKQYEYILYGAELFRQRPIFWVDLAERFARSRQHRTISRRAALTVNSNGTQSTHKGKRWGGGGLDNLLMSMN
jgi:hypothetical protein